MTNTNLNTFLIQQLEDAKALDIVSMDVTELTNVTDTMIICTGTSNRHVKAIADRVFANAKAAGFAVLGSEGELEGEWALVDLGDAIVHVMQQPARDYYQLEKLWEKLPRAKEKEA
jgi:ribosome-associated protein